MGKLTESMLSELAAERAAAAANLTRFCPGWDGDSYPTWRDYPKLPEDAPDKARDVLVVVMFLDAVLSQPALWEEFTFWGTTIEILRSAQRPFLAAGKRARLDRPKKMRAGRSKKAAERRRGNRRRAESALDAAGGDTAAAAKHVGKSTRTLNRWLGGK